MPYFHDLEARGRTLVGGGGLIAELVTAALDAGLDVPAALRGNALAPGHARWLLAAAQQLGRDELARFLVGTGEAPLRAVVRAPPFAAWLADAIEYYRALGFFARIDPDGDAVARAWPDDPDAAFARGDVPDAALLVADDDLVIDGVIEPRPLARACAYFLERVAELGRRTRGRALRFGDLGRGLYELDIVDITASEDAVEIVYTVDGATHAVCGYAGSKYALQLDSLVTGVNRAIAASGRRLYVIQSPQIVVLLPPDVADRLRRERGVMCGIS